MERLQQKIELQDRLAEEQNVRLAETRDKLELQDCLNAAMEREMVLRQALANSEQALHETKVKAAGEMHNLREAARFNEDAIKVDYETVVKELRQEIATGMEAVSELQVDAEWLRDSIDKAQGGKQDALNRNIELEQSLAERGQVLRTLQQEAEDMKETLARTEEVIDSLNEEAQNQAVEMATKCDELTSMKEQRRQWHKEKRELVDNLRQAQAFKDRVLAMINHNQNDDTSKATSEADKENQPPPQLLPNRMPTSEESGRNKLEDELRLTVPHRDLGV